jgi:hypothetical protein
MDKPNKSVRDNTKERIEGINEALKEGIKEEIELLAGICFACGGIKNSQYDPKFAIISYRKILTLLNKFALSTTLKPSWTELERILDGIDRQETDDKGGWWETSVGAEFGKQKLKELKQALLGQGGEND